jgi:hypothetical protein
MTVTSRIGSIQSTYTAISARAQQHVPVAC